MDILLIILLSLTVVCIKGQPILVTSDLIQGEPGSVTCTTDDGTVIIYNKADRITNCLVTSTSCIFNPVSITNGTGIYTLTKGETTVGSYTFSVTVNILQVSTQRDGGLWTCQGFGVSNVTKTIDVKVPVSSVTIQPTNSVFIDGESNTISCIPSGTPNPLPTFKWYKDGQLLSETTSTLNYLADKDDDGKIILCSANNGYSGTKTSQLILDIKFPVPDVTLENKNNLIFIDKQFVSVTCKTGVSNPSATVTWFIDGNEQATSSVTTTPNSDGTTTSILQFNTQKSYNNKIIQCTAYNGYGESTTDSGTLTIQYRPVVHLEPSVNKYRIIQGRQLQLTCVVSDSNPVVSTFTWKKNNVNISSQTSSVLRFPSINKTDKGSYTCTASNTIGSTITSPIVIDVLYGPSVTVSPDITVKENTRVILSCSVDSNPLPVQSIFNWYKPDGSIVYAVDDLVITSINRIEAGIYTCNVSTILNPTEPAGFTERKSDGKTTNVVVQYLDPVVIFTDKTQVEEGGRINITCFTNSYPVASIIWFNESQRIQVKKTNKGSYIKEDVSCLDTNDYSCSASNTVFTSSVNKTLKLLVKCSPRQDPRVTSIRTVTGNITQIVYLVADVISYPPPSFTWYYIEDNMVIYISNKDPFKQIDTTLSTNTYKSTLTINITSKLLYRTYRVNVSNDDGGYKILDYNLILQSKPDPPYQLKIQSQSNNQICVEWKPGFNGGATQTFIVQHSTDHNTWVDSSPIPVRNDGQLIQYCITDLEKETQYYITMTAKNIAGESQIVYFHNIVKTIGQKVTLGESEEYSKGRASGIASGMSSGIGVGIGIGIGIGIGMSVALVLLVLVAFYIYRRLIIGKQKGTNADENYSTLNRGTASGEPPTYQELNDIRTYENLGVDTNIVTNSTLDPYINTGNT